MLIIQCPHCGSTSAKSRAEVYSSGTSHYSGRSSTRGFSFGLSRNSRPRVWVGCGRSSGKRQSVKVQNAERFPFYPGLLIAGFIYFSHDQALPYSEGKLWGLAAAALLFVCSCYSLYCFFTEWLCNRCGESFTPKPLNEINAGPEIVSGKIPTAVFESDAASKPQKDIAGKSCSICGAWFRCAEFNYGNRSNRSYCRECDKLEKMIYSHGGKEAAKLFRDKMRSTRAA